MFSFRPQKAIPNAITLLNLLSGSLGILVAFEGNLALSGLLIILAALFDFLDGFSARLLNAYSEIGKQLDSLADVISFGLLPSIIVFQLLRRALDVSPGWWDPVIPTAWLLPIPFLLVAFSALRLAKFNIDERQTTDFIGLPTPASALFVAALPLTASYQPEAWLVPLIGSPIFLTVISIALAAFMVSEIPMFSLKFKNLRFSENAHRFLFLLVTLILLIFLRQSSVPLVIGLYILLSVVLHLRGPLKTGQH